MSVLCPDGNSGNRIRTESSSEERERCDSLRKTASPVLAQDANARNRIIGCCAARENIVPQYKDGCLATLAGGIEKLLFQKPRSGRPRIMNPETIERLSNQLQEPEGFSSYKEVHQWLTSCCEVKVAYLTVHQYIKLYLYPSAFICVHRR